MVPPPLLPPTSIKHASWELGMSSKVFNIILIIISSSNSIGISKSEYKIPTESTEEPSQGSSDYNMVFLANAVYVRAGQSTKLS